MERSIDNYIRVFTSIFIGFVVSWSICFPTSISGVISTQAGIVESDVSQSWPSDTLPSSISYGMERTFRNVTDESSISIGTTNTIVGTNMTFSDIRVQDMPVIIETYSTYPVQANESHDICFFQEIKVPSSCYIPWVSIFIEYINFSASLDEWHVSIFNATFGFPDPKPIPGKEVAGCSNDNVDPRWELVPGLGQYISHWENVTMPLVLLDTNNTVYYDGTYHFFIAVRIPKNNGEQQFWFVSADGDGLGIDYGTAFSAIIDPLNEGDTERVFPVEYPGIDFCVLTKLVPCNATPNPSDIFMKVNGEPIVDASNGEGYYNSTVENFPDEGRISYEISSAWSDLFPGSITYDLILDYELNVPLSPEVMVNLNETTGIVSWQADYTVMIPVTSTSEMATLCVEFPRSWSVLTLRNITLGNNQIYDATTISTSTDGRKAIFKATAITTGTWRLSASSDIHPLSFNLDVPSTGLDLDDVLAGNATIVNGPNGQLARIVSGRGLDGRITNITVIKGTSNSSNHDALLDPNDSESISFYNKTGQDLREIFIKIATGIPISDYEIEGDVDVDFILPEGFDVENVQYLDLNMRHAIPSESWWYGNITGGNCPDNPFWNPTYVSAEDALERMIFYDIKMIPVNFTYNVSAQRWSDFYVNYSLAIFNQEPVGPEKIEELAVDIVTYFKFDDANHELYIKNQSSPVGEYILLQNVQKSREYANHTRVKWTSHNDPSFTNISQFIIPNSGNQVELYIRTYNTTTVSTNWQIVGIDMAALNFTFVNELKNFTILAYNWTDGQYFPVGMNLTVPREMTTTHIDLDGLLDNLEDMLDTSTGKLRFKVNLTASTPLFNVVSWHLDALSVNMTYTNYVRCNWTQTISTQSTADETYFLASTTLFDSPSNNQTIRVPIYDVVSYDDDYQYKMIWSNGTDIGIASQAFIINRYAVSLSIVSGIFAIHHQAGTSLVIKVSLVHALNSSGIPAKPVIMEVEVQLRDGSEMNATIPSFTDEDGIASFSIQPEDTWASFEYSIHFNDTDPRFKPAATRDNSTYVIETAIEYAGRIIVENIIVIIAAAAILAVALVARTTNDAKKRKSWKTDSDKIRDVVKIQHLMVIMKNSGSCVVNRSYTPEQIDADLVSGFLHAITTFGKEIGPKSSRNVDEGVTFDYQHFKILILDGQHVRLALILDAVPTESMKMNGKAFLDYFEGTFNLSDWKGNLDMFTTVDNMIEQAFEITLVYPLVVNKEKETKKIKSKLGRALHEVGMAVQKEKRVFYLATLVNYAKAGRKEPEDQVLAEIYNLKKDGYFTFFSPE